MVILHRNATFKLNITRKMTGG